MIEDTLALIEDAVAKIEASDAAKKAEVLRLLAALKSELARGKSAVKPQPALLDGLRKAADDFEASHPRLAEVVGELCRELASLGI
jgi:hypothetical protein